MDIYDIILYVGYALVVIGAIISIFMPLVKSLDDPKSLLKTGAGILSLVVLFLIAYSISGNEVLPKFEESPFNLTPASSQLVGGMLICTYILAIIAIVSILITEVNKAIK
jgi:NADH:ubiquinone oxidoreductase subunit 6 (subunit J)